MKTATAKDSKITVGIKNNYEDFSLTDNERTIAVGEKHDCNVAVAGYCNAISSIGKQSQISVAGNGTVLDANADGSATAIAGDLADLSIRGTYTRTAVAGDDGRVSISGESSRAAICLYDATINVSGDNNRLVISDPDIISIAGNGNKIIIVGDSPYIICDGDRNIVTSLGVNATFIGSAGNYISLANYDENGNFVGYVTGCIGRNGIKENVRYCVNYGKFIKAFRGAGTIIQKTSKKQLVNPASKQMELILPPEPLEAAE